MWPASIEWILVIGGAILLAVIVKMVLLQAFYIPSASMYPTLQKGDRVLVNKISYKLHDVNRGDVVVFERPPSETATNIPDLIKRVVGLPGEQIVIEGGRVYIDGQLLDEPYLPEGVTTTAENAPLKCAREAPCVVPEGDVWVMGDNRNDSKDSRYFGPIDEDSIVGRAFVVVWPLEPAGPALGQASRSSSLTIRSTWSLYTPSIPERSSSRSTRSCCASHPKASTSKRWTMATSPPFQSVWCMFSTSIPASALRATWSSGLPSRRLARVDSTSFTSGDSSLHPATVRQSGWQSHRRASAPASRAVATTSRGRMQGP